MIDLASHGWKFWMARIWLAIWQGGLLALAQAPIAVAEEPSAPAAPRSAPKVPKNLNPYVYVKGDSRTMSGSMEDVHRVDSLKSKYGSQFLWFKRGSKEYVITDASTLKAIDAFQAPQIALAHQQAELGKKQGALADQQEQSKLAKQQAEIWRQVEEKIAQTLETAMANGIAKPVTP